jgi:hypothetical protein
VSTPARVVGGSWKGRGGVGEAGVVAVRPAMAEMGAAGGRG